jgi:hypothetical protein
MSATPSSEFLVNTSTANDQKQSTVEVLANGRFIMAWRDHSLLGGDASGSGIKGQLFDASGSKLSAEFLINTVTTNDQLQPTIAALPDGRFVVAWTDASQWAGGLDSIEGGAVRMQMFDVDGNRQGAEFLIGSTTTHDRLQPTLTVLADGRFVAAWTDHNQLEAGDDAFVIHAQVFDSDGNASGPELLVNTTTTNQQYDPKLSALTNGGFVATWTDESQTGGDLSGTAIRAQIFNADGTKAGAEFLVNTSTNVDQYDASVTALSNGGFVAAWTDVSGTGEDTFWYAARAQVFNANGSKAGAEFLLNTTTVYDQFDPSLAPLADGRFVATWSDSSQSPDDASGYAIRAQVFNTDGSKSGSELLVNTTTHSDQEYSQVRILNDGRFVVTWSDRSQSEDDTSGSAIRAKIFDPRESAIDLSGTTLNDDFVGTRWADTMRGGAGVDRMQGATGNDNLFGDSGRDTLIGGYGNDSLYGGSDGDRLDGGMGNDTLNGGGGSDTLIGGKGHDVYYIDSPTDQVIESTLEGIDTLITGVMSLNLSDYAFVENALLIGTLDLNLTGNAGKNTLTGNAGANLILGLGGDDTISALAGNDTVNGGAGNDLIEGGAGNDTLNGGTGMDTLFGGVGKDRLIGGADADVFAFRTKAEAGNGVNRDVIVDFVVGLDKIDLSAIDANELLEGNQAFSFIGDTAFGGMAGELRYAATSGFIYADTNGDTVADFQLQLIGKPVIAAADFEL